MPITNILLQLKEGTLVQVPPSLVKRCKTHFLNLPCGATLILGNNGYVWISPLNEEEAKLTDGQTDRLVIEDTPSKQVVIHKLALAQGEWGRGMATWREQGSNFWGGGGIGGNSGW